MGLGFRDPKEPMDKVDFREGLCCSTGQCPEDDGLGVGVVFHGVILTRVLTAPFHIATRLLS